MPTQGLALLAPDDCGKERPTRLATGRVADDERMSMQTTNGHVQTPHERRDAPLAATILRAGHLAPDAMRAALDAAEREGKRLSEFLVTSGRLDESVLARLLAEQAHLDLVSLRDVDPDPHAIALLTPEVAWATNAVPVAFREGIVIVALADPSDETTLRTVWDALAREARFVVAPRSEVMRALAMYYTPAVAAETADADVAATASLAGDTHALAHVQVPPPAPPAPAPVASPAVAPAAASSPPAPASPSSDMPRPRLQLDPPAPPPPPSVVPEAPATRAGPEVAAPAAAPSCRVVVRLSDGDRVETRPHSTADEAHAAAAAIVESVVQSERLSRWPVVAGRHLRPETIVSVDVVETAAPA